MKTPSRRPSAALIVAILALVVSMSGTAVAAKMLTGKDIKDSSLTGKDVKNGSLTASDLGKGVIVHKAIPRKRVVATSGVNIDAARAAAPEVVLFRKGAITIYAKCFVDLSVGETYSEVSVKTSRDGAILDSREDSLEGGSTAGDFLNTTTLETDRQLETDSAAPGTASMGSQDDSDFTIFAPDGTTLRGWTGAAVKSGNLMSGNGVYGEGNVCLFTGAIFAA
ncbi:hypothetical protein [Nocardioides sp.]|uniref:hypothetical protein n=1 Tax=Nocardioides sp. TaxID=35761 RepID=UPI003511A827